MKIVLLVLAFLSGLVILWIAIKIFAWLIWWMLSPKSWYLYNARTWSGKNGPRFVAGFYRRYGEAKASVLLIQEVQKRLKKIDATIRVGGEANKLYTEVREFGILMHNSINALKATDLAATVFPALEALVRVFSYLEPRELKVREEEHLELEIGDFSGDIPLGSYEHVVKNPAMATFEEILKELTTTSWRRGEKKQE